MERNDALEKLKAPSWDPETIDRDLEFVASKLGITRAELESYLTMPLRTWRDYASQRTVYRVGARAMRLLGL